MTKAALATLVAASLLGLSSTATAGTNDKPLSGLHLSLSLSLSGGGTKATADTIQNSNLTGTNLELGSTNFGARADAAYFFDVSDSFSFGVGAGLNIAETKMGSFKTSSGGQSTSFESNRKGGGTRFYIQPELKLSPRTAVYFRAGMTKDDIETKLTTDSGGGQVVANDTIKGKGTLIGGGVRTMFSPTLGFQAGVERVSYKEQKGIEAETVEANFGIDLSF